MLKTESRVGVKETEFDRALTLFVVIKEAKGRDCSMVGQRLEMTRQSRIINQSDSNGLDVIQKTDD